jgi:tellurite resistance-related uncharacterized protein
VKRLFPIPPPIVVPDGTKLHEIVGPRILGESQEKSRINDGLSLALGILPAGITSKVHVHPVVWHFTWVRHGTLTVKMKDADCDNPYELVVPEQHGVLTEPGTFFQLLNKSEQQQCEVYYFVGPAFVFEASDSSVLYNDAVVFDLTWEDLAQLNWQPPGLPSPLETSRLRHESLLRTSSGRPLQTVIHERWSLLNGPGSVAVPSALHGELTLNPIMAEASPMDPSRIGQASAAVMGLVNRFVTYLQENVGLQLEPRFLQTELPNFVKLKCGETPSVLAEYELAARILGRVDAYVHSDEVWHLLTFGQHAGLYDLAALSRVRRHVLNELFDFAVTIGGGFRSTGAMDNYRAYRGGLYLDSSSYQHYTDKDK